MFFLRVSAPMSPSRFFPFRSFSLVSASRSEHKGVNQRNLAEHIVGGQETAEFDFVYIYMVQVQTVSEPIY